MTIGQKEIQWIQEDFFMKKMYALLLSAALVLSLAACANTGNDVPDSSDAAVTETEPETVTETEEETIAATEEEATSPEEGEGSESDSGAAAILTTVWDSYGEDEKFPAFGGNPSVDSLNTDGPAAYAPFDAEAMDSSLGFPSASLDKIDDAATLIHMMNANTFTCGVYHVADPEDTDATITALKDNILARQWMCGFPEKLVIYTVDDYIVAVFGHGEPVDTFTGKLTAVYASAQLISDDPIM